MGPKGRECYRGAMTLFSLYFPVTWKNDIDVYEYFWTFMIKNISFGNAILT